MTQQSHIDVSTLCTITVTFNPDIALLEAQFRTLPQACSKFIVDNASSEGLFEQIQLLVGRTPNAHVLRNDSNIGLAAAINRGVQVASVSYPAPEFVLLLDQDSEPRAGSVETLVAAFRALECDGQHVGCVGPLLLDPQTRQTHGFHQCTRWRWKRVYPSMESAIPVPCVNLNGSGTLVRIELFLQLGGLDEPLFIDHVDTEWAFRVLGAGYTLWGIPNAVFIHRMGQKIARFWFFGWQVWPSRSPQRHYYLFRNAVALIRRPYVPRVWKTWAVAKLCLTFVICACLDRHRLLQMRAMLRGATQHWNRS